MLQCKLGARFRRAGWMQCQGAFCIARHFITCRRLKHTVHFDWNAKHGSQWDVVAHRYHLGCCAAEVNGLVTRSRYQFAVKNE